jgi:hypothetical protein
MKDKFQYNINLFKYIEKVFKDNLEPERIREEEGLCI